MKSIGRTQRKEQNQTLCISLSQLQEKQAHIFLYEFRAYTSIHIIQHSLMSGEMNCNMYGSAQQ